MFHVYIFPIFRVARVYADVTKQGSPKDYDYENFVPEFNNINDYEVIRKLGRGKYSEVLLGVNVTNDTPVVIKVLKPVNKKKIRREIMIMQKLRGGPSILSLYDTVKDPMSKTMCLISEHVNSVDFKFLYPTLTDRDIRYYCYLILKGLDFAHSRGVMHRDIKPHNVMIDHEKKQLRIIDWGLAEFYHASVKYNVRVASRYYKGPELLVNMKDYDYSLDMWSFGCVLGGMIFKMHTLFRGKDNVDQLVRIAKMLGAKSILSYVSKYGAEIEPAAKKAIGNLPSKSFSALITPENKDLAVDDALDLLNKVLVIDHNDRLTAAEAMAHPYFDPVRDEIEASFANSENTQ